MKLNIENWSKEQKIAGATVIGTLAAGCAYNMIYGRWKGTRYTTRKTPKLQKFKQVALKTTELKQIYEKEREIYENMGDEPKKLRALTPGTFNPEIDHITLEDMVNYEKDRPVGSKVNGLKNTSRQFYDIIIVGAGVVGCALAIKLSQRYPNKTILNVERSYDYSERIVGELLQAGGYEIAKAMGLDECLEGIDASRIFGYGVFRGETKVKLTYPKDKKGNQPEGRGIHYGRFVQKLRERMSTLHNVTALRATVDNKLMENGDTIVGITTKGNGLKKTFYAPFTFVATGSHSSLARKLSPLPKRALSRGAFVGFRIRDCCDALPFPEYGHVILREDSGPVLVYPTSYKDARVLVDFPNGTLPKTMQERKDYIAKNVIPLIPSQKVQESMLSTLKTDDLVMVNNTELPPQMIQKHGIMLLGDSLCQRHPLTGAGMTAGLIDVQSFLAALDDCDCIFKDDGDYLNMHHVIQSWWNHRKRVNGAPTINVLANALYSVFTPQSTSDPYQITLQSACFTYFKQGEKSVNGPIRLLGAISRSENLLAKHYVRVAIVAVGEAFQKSYLFGAYYAFRSIRCAFNLITPIMGEEGVFSYFFPSNFFNRFDRRK
mmetsp:Transcript_202/g.347  ORF Transcript_202/g.347 Transcript_202/m.347 type:complete len:604 (+) Transcript_202:104-1915(+)